MVRLQAVLWTIAILLGGIDAWVGRYWMNADGISYLDLGDAYLRGDWLMIANAYWSPLYPLLLAFARVVSGSSPQSEFLIVSLVNFIIYLGALASFHFLLIGLIRYQKSQATQSQREQYLIVPEWLWLVLGYAVFIWSSLYLVSLKVASPDLCVAAFVYLIAGIMVRIRLGDRRSRTFFLLGMLLGLGYLAKAPLFPLSFVFLGVTFLLLGNLREALRRVSIAFVVFALMAAPLVAMLSFAKGRLTFGDSGRLNYAWLVNGVTYRHWQGENPGGGTPLHPTRKILSEPAVYEFGSPLAATYPLWYDPSYWYDGVEVPFNFRRQLKPILTGLKEYYGTYFNLHVHKQFQNNTTWMLFPPVLTLALLLLLLMSRWSRGVVRSIAGYWFLFLPGLAGLMMYLLVYVEPRHVAAFPVLLYLSLFGSIQLPNSTRSKRLVKSVVVVVSVIFAIFIGISTFRTPAAPNVDWQVAEGLKQMGLRPGDKVAALKYANAAHAKWARLARVQIVAEMFTNAFRADEDEFWLADDSVKRRVIQAFAQSGANVIVANSVPSGAVTEGWRRVGNTGYYAYFVSEYNP